MAFDVSAEAYGRFMGRFSEPLAELFADYCGIALGQQALDVGCGPGALTAVLVSRLEDSAVSAIDPSQGFVEATSARCPGVDVRTAVAEDLPFQNGSFDVVMAQLVLHFMSDPVKGLREMSRVTRPGGVVAACVWDHAGGHGPISTFWEVVHELDPNAGGESELAGVREGDLTRLCDQAGFTDLDECRLTVEVSYDSFADWWEPYTLGVGPVGDYLKGRSDRDREDVRLACAARLPDGPFTVEASAWTVRAPRPVG